jgi:hypothetical protein
VSKILVDICSLFTLKEIYTMTTSNSAANISTKIALQLDDGTVKLFDTKAEAVSFLQRPQQRTALGSFIDDKQLIEWILDNREDIEGAFEAAKIARVTKAERKLLASALEAVKAAGDKSTKFITDNAEAILNSFRWPSVKRGSDEEQAAQVLASMTEVCGGAEGADLAEFLVANKENLLAGFEAGAVKREVSPKAVAGLAAYRERMAAEKLAKETAAAEAAGMTLEAYRAKVEADKEAAKAK